MPGPGDHLDHMDATALVTRSALEASADPVALTMPLLDGIEESVQRLDDVSQSKIEAAGEVVKAHGAEAWSLKGGLLELRDHLEALGPQLTNPTERELAERMHAALVIYVNRRC